MKDNILYTERVSSNWTEALFLTLTIIFLLLFIWHVTVSGLDILAVVLLGLFSFFLFYSVNYRTLLICLTPEFLKLTFGIFIWRVPLENIAEFHLDEIPLFNKLSGAGIHFMFVRHRYRASLNFLEHPRVVIALKRKAGPVRDISFSTRRPDDVLRLIDTVVSANRVA